jgi:multidrug efflux pump subunit AcrA (membrane-fusion protein)
MNPLLQGVTDAQEKVTTAQTEVEDAQAKVDTAQAKVTTAQTEVDNSQNDQTKQQELDTAKQELDTAKQAFDTAKQALDTAKQALDTAKTNLAQQQGTQQQQPGNIASGQATSGTTTPANIASGSEDNIYIKLEGDNKYVILTKEEANKIMEDEQKKNVTPSSVVIMTRDSKDKCFTFNDGSKPEEKKGWFSWGSKKPAQVTTGGNLRTKKRRITKKRVQKRRPFKSRSKK